jgi:hypothetical protein
MIVGNVRIISTLRITISVRYKTFQKKTSHQKSTFLSDPTDQRDEQKLQKPLRF